MVALCPLKMLTFLNYIGIQLALIPAAYVGLFTRWLTKRGCRSRHKGRKMTAKEYAWLFILAVVWILIATMFILFAMHGEVRYLLLGIFWLVLSAFVTASYRK